MGDKTNTRIADRSKKEDEGIKPKVTFKELLNQYYENEGLLNDSKNSRSWRKGQVNKVDEKFGFLANKSIYDITSKQLTHWRNKRSLEVGANTVLKEISFYSAVFTYAQKELFLLEDNT